MQVDVSKSARRGVKVVKALLEGEQGEIVATWYNRYQIENLSLSQYTHLGVWTFEPSLWFRVGCTRTLFYQGRGESAPSSYRTSRLRLTEGVGKVDMVRVTDAALAVLEAVSEPLTPEQCAHYGMMGYREAIPCHAQAKVNGGSQSCLY